MQLDIVTPDRRVFQGESTAVIVPGLAGEFEVLPGHAPMLSVIGTGILTFMEGSKTTRVMVSGGFVEVDGDKVTLMTEVSAAKDDIRRELEEKSLHQSSQQLAALGPVSSSDESFKQLKAEVDRAAAKLTLIK